MDCQNKFDERNPLASSHSKSPAKVQKPNRVDNSLTPNNEAAATKSSQTCAAVTRGKWKNEDEVYYFSKKSHKWCYGRIKSIQYGEIVVTYETGDETGDGGSIIESISLLLSFDSKADRSLLKLREYDQMKETGKLFGGGSYTAKLLKKINKRKASIRLAENLAEPAYRYNGSLSGGFESGDRVSNLWTGGVLPFGIWGTVKGRADNGKVLVVFDGRAREWKMNPKDLVRHWREQVTGKVENAKAT